MSMASTAVVIHMLLNQAEQNKVCCDDHNCDDQGNGWEESCKDGTEHASSEGNKERNESQTARNRMKNHDASQCLGGVFRGEIEVGVVDLSHNLSGIVADVAFRAGIMIRVCSPNIELAIAKGAEIDSLIVAIGVAAEIDLQDRDVMDDWSTDCCDQDEDGGYEEQKGADVMKNASSRHFESNSWSSSKEGFYCFDVRDFEL